MNYYAEIERFFIKKRGRGLMLSPKDWQVMSEWEDGGIPLQVILRGIDKTFSQKGSEKQEINFLAYCKPQVDECWREYKKQTLGSADLSGGKPALPKEEIMRHLTGFKRELQTKLKPDEGRFKLWQPVQASLDNLIFLAQFDQLESKLEIIRQQLLEILRDIMPQAKLKQIEAEAEAELKTYRRWMRPEAYQATYRELVGEWVFKFYGLPELRLYEL